METAVKKLYEGMFLVDSALAAADWDGINGLIKGLLERAGAEIVSMRKWDDRKLAYEIQSKSRGTYILCYFHAGGDRISSIERSIQLSEKIMRVLILCVEHLPRESMDKPTPVSISKAIAQKDSQEAESESETAAEPEDQEQYAEAEESEPDLSEADEQEEAVSETAEASAAAKEAETGLSGQKERESEVVSETQEAGEESEQSDKDI